jgi:CheY-like chemotaxis protein
MAGSHIFEKTESDEGRYQKAHRGRSSTHSSILRAGIPGIARQRYCTAITWALNWALTCERLHVIILLAEDDERVRVIFAEALSLGGYTVLEASDGAEALKISRNFPEDIHFLLTDLNMPNLSGLDLACRLLNERPGIKVIIMTGNSTELPISWLARVIEKPVHPRVVLGRIDRELGLARAAEA